MPTVTFEPFPFLSSGATATVGDFILTAVQTPQSGAVSSFSQFPVGGSPGDLSFGGQQNWTFTITHKDGAIFDVDSARVVTVEGGVIADTLVFATPDGESETLSFISGAPGGMQSPPLSLGTDFEGISSVSITGNSAGGAQRVFVDDIVISNVSQPGPIPTRPIDDVARTQETAGTEPFSLVLSNLGDGPVIGTQAVVETVATLTASSTAIAEAGGMSTLTITLDRPAPAGGVSIPLTVGGTASHNLDFSLSTAQVAFTAGSTSQTVTVYALPDTTDDDAESVTIGLGPPSNSDVILGTPSQQTISIIDDDQAPAINLASVSVHEADGAATLAVTLDRPSSQPVSVTVGTTNTGTATAGVDFAPISQTVVFAPGDIRETVTIIIGDNSVVEDVETVIVSLSAPTNATIGAAGSGTVTITDSDSAFLSIGDAQITEADGELSLDFEIRLSSAVDTGVSVTAATRDGSAGAGSDYTAVTTTARIAAGSLSTTVSVPILGDNLDEAAESFELVLSNLDAGGRAVSLPYAVGLGTIFDDDAAPVATDDDLAMDEGTDLAGDVRANDSDADDGRDALTITLTDDVDNGRLTLNTDGTFAYTPDAGFTGVDSFTYSASDGTNTASATAMITVRRVLDAPVAVADTTTIIGPDSAELDVLANDVDGQGDGLTITALDLSLTTGLAEILSSAGAADRILYTPTVLPGTPDTPLIDTLHYTISDGPGNEDTGIVRITLQAPPLPNDPGPPGGAPGGGPGGAAPDPDPGPTSNRSPEARDDVFVRTTIGAVSGSVFAENGAGPDTDPDGDTLTLTILAGATPGEPVTLPSGATVSATSTGAFTYDHGAAFADLPAGSTLSDGFSYTISDGRGGTDRAEVVIRFEPPGDTILRQDGTGGDDGFTLPDTATPREVNGGPGQDSARLPGILSSYVVEFLDGGFRLTPLGGAPQDLLSIETISFDDVTVEAVTNADATKVALLYDTAFNRFGDAPGVTYWTEIIAGGVAMEVVAEAFAASEEFALLNGSNSDAGAFFDVLYTNTYGRIADGSGRAFWVSELTTGAITRGEAMILFACSEEAAIVNANAIDDGILLLA